MYFGPAKDAVPYFAALNFRSPVQFNPADFFLDLLSVDPRSPEREQNTRARVQYLGDRYEGQAQPVPVDVSADQDIEAAHGETHESEVALKDKQYQTSWINEFSVLCSRAIKLAFRERASNVVRLIQVIFFSIILGLIWLNNGRDEDVEAQRSLLGVLFFVIINQAFGGVFAVIFGFPLERSVVTRERASSTYRTSSYFLSKTVTDFPKTLFFNVIFCLIVYWMIGLRADAGAFFIFLLVIFLISTLAESLAIAVSIMTGDAQAAAGIIPVFVILAILFGGFFIESEQLAGWISWAKYLSFVFYAFNALGRNEFQGNPPGSPTGSQDIFSDLTVWENVAALVAIFVLFRLAGYLFLQYLRGPKFLKF